MSTWTQAFGNPRRTSAVSEGPDSLALYCQWYTTFEPFVHPYVQPIADPAGDIYVATSAGLHKINGTNGAVIWSYPGRYACTPAYGNDSIYAALADGRIVSLNAATGAERWTWQRAQAGFDADVLLTADGSRVVAGNRDGCVYCLHATTGAQAWQYPAAGNAPGAPWDSGAAEHNGSVYLLSNDMHLYKLSLASGALQGTSPKLLGEMFRWFPPVIDPTNGFIYIPTSAPLFKKWWAQAIGAVTWRGDEQIRFWSGASGANPSSVTPDENGFNVYDYSARGDATQSVLEFVNNNPDYVNMQVLTLSDLSEYTLGSAYNNVRVPLMAAARTYTQNRFPCVVSDDGKVYLTNWRYAPTPEGDLNTSAGVFQWEVGTPRFKHMRMSPAWDEPLCFCLGAANLLHAGLTVMRTAYSTDTTVPDSFKVHWNYTEDGSGLGAIAPGWNDFMTHFDGQIGMNYSYDGVNQNGPYGYHQYTGQPVPVGNKLLYLAGNTLVCLGTTVRTTGVRAPNVPPVASTPTVTISDAAARLTAALAFVNTETVQHLRPALVGHTNEELWWQHPERLFNGYGIYGRWISETLTPLLRAYPHVSAALQAKIRTYVKTEWAAWSPYAGYPHLPETGEGHLAREWSDQGSSNIRSTFTPGATTPAYQEGWSDDYAWRLMPMYWHFTWLMCQTLTPDAEIDPAAIYTQMKNLDGYKDDYSSLQNHARDGLFKARPIALNAHISGLYGRWQLALLAGETADATAAKSLLDDYVAFWNDNFSKDIPDAWANYGGERFDFLSILAHQWWLWLIPEAVALIKADDGYNQAKIDAALHEMTLNAPFWDLRYFARPSGEGQTQPLYDYEAIFGAKRLFQDAGQAELAPYLDAPVFATGDYQYINALVTYLTAAEPPPPAQLALSELRVLTPGEIKLYERFEIAFDITGSSATRPDWPYDPNTPAGIEAKTGITVNAELLGPGESDWNKSTALPCFNYQPVKAVEERLTPTGATEWRWRFSPPRAGEWRYRVRAIDASGSVLSDEAVFTATASDAAGYIKLNSDSFFVTQTGAAFTAPLVNIGGGYWPFGKANEIRTNLTKLADAGVQFMRWFPTGESGSNIIPFGDDIVSSWGFGSAYITRDELDAGKEWSFVPYYYSNQRIALEANKAYALQFRAKITGSRQLVVKVASEGGRVLASQTFSGPLDWTTQTLFFNSDTVRNAIVWLVNGTSETDDTEGKPYLSGIALHGDEGGTTGPNLLSRADPDTHTHVDAISAAYLDLVLEESAARGIYHRLTLFHKNDALLARMQSDGTWGEHDVNNFYAGSGQAARWLELAYVRYFLARWGYSPAIHSLELANENMLSDASYDAAFTVAEYIKVHEPRPILQSNSFWGWYVDAFWNDPQRRDLMDYADKHWYESTEPDNYNGELVGSDWADSAASVRKAYRRFLQYEAAYRPGQPIIRGETGVRGPDGDHPELPKDTDGVYLHKMLWANVGCVRHSVAGEWAANLIDKNDLWRHFGAYRNFMAAETNNRADYTDIGTDLTGDAAVLLEMQIGALRAWGQRHRTNNSFLLWIDNPSQTWYNVVQGATVIPASGTATVQNLQPGRYVIQRWNTNDGTVMDTSEINVTGTRQLAFRVTGLTSDVAFKVSRLGETPPPVTQPLPVEKIRAVAWRALYPVGGLKVDPESPLSLAAAKLNLGLPTTNETTYQDWVIQGFAGGILNAIPDQWDDIRLVSW